MQEGLRIPKPSSDSDVEGARRVFCEFFDEYHLVMIGTEQYFGEILENVQPEFSKAYAPWHTAVRDLLHGVYRISNSMSLKNPKNLADAMRFFGLHSTVDMLDGVCRSCRFDLSETWTEDFRENMQVLGEAYRILQNSDSLKR